MSTEVDSDKGIRILSFDSGGPGSYSQLAIIKQYMGRLASDLGVNEEDVCPAAYFELMGGVGFGGLIAFMLGYLEMGTDQAIDTMLMIANAVFPYGSNAKSNPETNMLNLRRALEDMLQSRVLYAAMSANLTRPQIFRTYSSRGSNMNPTIVDALCATMATPPIFSPVIFGPRQRQQSFVGGPFGARNPTREVLKEAHRAFGDDIRVAQIISIGAGRRRALSLETLEPTDAPTQLLRELATDCELVANDLSTRLFGVDAYIRLDVDRGMDCLSMDNWDDLGGIESHTSGYLEKVSVAKALDLSLSSLQSRVGTATLGQINHSRTIKVRVKSPPSLSPYYVLRKDEFGLMNHHLVEAPSPPLRIFPITGMGGCGKTQLVSYFLQQNQALYEHVIFVDASTSSTIKADLQAWTRSLGNDHEQDVWDDALRTLERDFNDRRWVLILDNADDPTLRLKHFIPNSGNGTIIITSRNRNAGNLSTTAHLELGEMKEDEALDALLQAARRLGPLSAEEATNAHRLLVALGFLAVAIVQAGTYCHQLSPISRDIHQQYSFKQYNDLFSSHRAALMKRVEQISLDDYQLGAYTAFDLSYKAVPEMARDFFQLLSSFHNSSISFALFAAATDYSFADPYDFFKRPGDHVDILTRLKGLMCSRGVWDEMQVHESIHTLLSFSLVSVNALEGTILLQLHPLVHAWARDTLLPDSQYHRRMALQVITSCSGVENSHLYRYLPLHLRDLMEIPQAHASHINDQFSAALVLLAQSQYEDAEVLFTVVMMYSMVFSPDDTNAAMVAGYLARTYHERGKWVEAESLQVELLKRHRDQLPGDHPDVLDMAADLAITYTSLGRYEEAERLELDVLERRKCLLGEHHPQTISAMANLAMTYISQGRYSQAEILQVTVLDQRKRLEGEDHTSTIDAMAVLGSLYNYQGRIKEAEILALEVLKQRKRLLGDDKLETIVSAGSLAAVYTRQERHSEAEELEEEVVQKLRTLLRPNHPRTIHAEANLATTYNHQGRYDLAEGLWIEILDRRTRLMGRDHPDTLQAALNLGVTYACLGKHGEAENMVVDTLKRHTSVLGKDHPNTIMAAAGLAATFDNLGRYEESEKLWLDTLERQVRVVGSEHQQTLVYMSGLADQYMKQEQWEKAIGLLLKVVKISQKVWGEDHPTTERYEVHLFYVGKELGLVKPP